MFQTQFIVDGNEPFRLILVSDMHIGLSGFRRDLFEKQLKDLSKPNTYWIGLGDFVEGRVVSHPLYNPNESEMILGDQYKYLFSRIDKYASTCLGMILGNHEESHVKSTQLNPIKDWCTRHKVSYLGNEGRVTIYSPTTGDAISVLAFHGAGGGATGAGINKAIGYQYAFIPDITVLGHHHKYSHTTPLSMRETDIGRIIPVRTDVIVNGALLDGYADEKCSYAEAKMMTPTLPGYAVLVFGEHLKLKYSQFISD